MGGDEDSNETLEGKDEDEETLTRKEGDDDVAVLPEALGALDNLVLNTPDQNMLDEADADKSRLGVEESAPELAFISAQLQKMIMKPEASNPLLYLGNRFVELFATINAMLCTIRNIRGGHNPATLTEKAPIGNS